MNKIIFEIDNGIESIYERKKDWNILYKESACNNPFLSWEWTYYWASNFSISKKIKILIGKLNNVVICIVPLQQDGSNIAFLRDNEYADYGGILIAKNLSHKFIKVVIDRIMLEYSNILFEAIRSDSPEFNLIEASIESKSIEPIVTFICDNPYVTQNNDFDAYYRTRSKKLRQEIRTTENHLSRMGEYEFAEEVKGEMYEKFLDKLAEFHTKRQSQKIGKSIFDNKNTLDFFKKAPQYLSTLNCQLHMSAILVNNKVISSVLSIQNHSTLYYWIPSFDKDVTNVSLGKLHIKFLIEKCHNENLIFDFMGGNEKYKYQWANSSVSVKNYIFFRNSLRKILYKNKQFMKQLLKERVSKNSLIKKLRIAISNN